MDGGRLAEADRLLDQAKEIELATLRQARDFKQKAQQAEDRHALNAAKLVSGQGSIAMTQLRDREAAELKDAAELVPASLPDEVRLNSTAKPMRFIEKVTSGATTRR